MHVIFIQQVPDASIRSNVQSLVGTDPVGLDSDDHANTLYLADLPLAVQSRCVNCACDGECCDKDFLHGYSQSSRFLGSRNSSGNLFVNPHFPISKFLKPTFRASDSGRTRKSWFPGSINSGSVNTECWSKPSACHSSRL